MDDIRYFVSNYLEPAARFFFVYSQPEIESRGMNLGRLKRKQPESPAEAVVQLRPGNYPFHILDRYVPLMTPETKLYACMREAIPVIDSALYKIQRLIGGFRFDM